MSRPRFSTNAACKVLNFGSEELKARIVPDVFAGKKFISLAISEAFAGSDVSGIKTTATLTEDGTSPDFVILTSTASLTIIHEP